MRFGRDSESPTGWSWFDPPCRHSIPCRDAFSTGSSVFALADSTLFSCVRPLRGRKRSLTGCPRFCLQPRWRSVVCPDECPSKNRICSSSPPLAWHSLDAGQSALLVFGAHTHGARPKGKTALLRGIYGSDLGCFNKVCPTAPWILISSGRRRTIARGFGAAIDWERGDRRCAGIGHGHRSTGKDPPVFPRSQPDRLR